jgi:yjeF N-terminal region
MPDPADLFDIASARHIDAQASALLGDGFGLMLQAGKAAWQCLLQRWPEAQRLVVVCGPGNNGGDGYVLARLARQSGRKVCVVHLPHGGPRTPLAQRACTEYLAQGGQVEIFRDALPPGEVVVDALFGIGLARAPEQEDAALIGAINRHGAPVFALDVPSGVDADLGRVPGAAVRAEVVLQFIVAHRGLYTGDALEFAGERLLAPLELPDGAFVGVEPSARIWDEGQLLVELPPRRLNTHKGESGRVLCIGGNAGSGGAVMLCAESALRSGAGLLSVATRMQHVAPLLARCPEVMALPVDDGAQVRPLLERAGVVAIGPAWGAMTGRRSYGDWRWPVAVRWWSMPMR